MENNEGKAKSTEEIDITQFFRWIGNGFKRVGNSIFYSVATLRNLFFTNILFFAIIVAAGLLLGVSYSKLLQKKYYKSTMVLSCDYLNTQILKNTIQKLSSLADEHTRQGLASELKIDHEISKNIQSFEFKQFVSEDDIVEMEVLREQLNNVAADKKDVVDKVLTKLTISNKNAYEISVLVYNPEIVKSLEKALVDYFKNNDYIKNRIEITRINRIERRNKLVRESRKLDSLKEVVYINLQNLSKSNRGSNNVILNDETLTNPLDLFTEDLKINQELLFIEEQLYLGSDFEIVDGFTAFSQPESANIIRILLISFVASFLAAYLILAIIYVDRKLASYPLNK